MIIGIVCLILVTGALGEENVTDSPTPTVPSEMSDLWAASLGMGFCPQDVCDCPAPNKFPGTITSGTHRVAQEDGTTAEEECLCSCGVAAGGLCEETGDCGLGTRCTAPRDWDNHVEKLKGVCSDRCDYVTCPQYHDCYINPRDGDAMCICEEYECNENLIIPVKGQRGAEVRIFSNRCLMENENCENMKKDAQAARWEPVPL